MLTGTLTTDCPLTAGVNIRFKPISGKGFVYSDRILGEKCGFRYYDQESETTVESRVNVYQQHWQKLQQAGLELLQSLSTEATKAGVKTEFKQSLGYPGRNICEFAQTWAAEVIIVGSRGLTGLKEMFLGSISNYVTHHAPCSVLIVREDVE